jgi:hypothetical protein
MRTLSLTPKNLFRLLMLMGKRLYTNRAEYEDVSNDELCNSIECELSEMLLIENLVRMAGTHMWSIEEFREHLSSTLSQEVDLSEDHKTVMEKFWVDTRDKIADVVQRDSCFNNKFENLAWRVDMKIASSKYSDINEPTAFFELTTSGKRNKQATPHLFERLEAGAEDKKDKEGDKICFEMNQGELKDMILELGKVKSAVEKAIE